MCFYQRIILNKNLVSARCLNMKVIYFHILSTVFAYVNILCSLPLELGRFIIDNVLVYVTNVCVRLSAEPVTCSVCARADALGCWSEDAHCHRRPSVAQDSCTLGTFTAALTDCCLLAQLHVVVWHKKLDVCGKCETQCPESGKRRIITITSIIVIIICIGYVMPSCNDQ